MGCFMLPIPVNNLRFPGQYFDLESGLHYNYFRYYDSGVGGYVTSDPIGLRGGVNAYSYAIQNPGNMIDPVGLTTYECKRPLGGTPGPDLRNYLDIPGNPLYHQYNCVTTKNGMKCDSTSPAPGYGDSIWPKPARDRDPGVPSDPKKDYYDPRACEVLEDDGDDCIEKCLEKKWGQPRPPYGVGITGTDCQEYSDDTYSDCFTECK
ncbi:MAG: RHS repeat-associated core domain-containing protein [Gammaproteobacteria bacterium]|nr:RHS repeat-associated core domain-containing protein [Gammaproteobacteria bacterium]